MIARALQTYGAYIVDSSSAFACYAQNTSTMGSNPYPSSWSNGISKSLIQRLRVVQPPAAPTYDDRTTFCQPTRQPGRACTRPSSGPSADALARQGRLLLDALL